MNFLDVRLNRMGINLFEQMIKDTKEIGRTGLCPIWEDNTDHQILDGCEFCEDCFPKINRPLTCPCTCGHYDAETLMCFLKQIVKQSREQK